MVHSRRRLHQPDRRPSKIPGGNNSEVEPHPTNNEVPPNDAHGAGHYSAEATGSPATTNRQQPGAVDESNNCHHSDNSSEDESPEDNEHGEQSEQDLDDQVTLIISKEDVQKRREEMETTVAVLYFFDRGLRSEQVEDWVDSELTKKRNLKVSSTTCMGSRHFHIQFRAQEDRDRALSRTRITFLRHDFIILKWTLEAHDHQFVPEHYPVWVRFPEPTSLQSQWLSEIAGTLGPVLLSPRRIEKTNRIIFRVCVEWKHGTPTPSSIPVKLGKKIELIPIDITHLPNSCFRCRRQGHFVANCPGVPLFATAQNGTGPGASTQTGQKGATRRTNRRHNGEAAQTKATTIQATKPPTAPQIVPQSKISNRTSGPWKEFELLRPSPPGGEAAAVEDTPKAVKQYRERGHKKTSRMEFVVTTLQVSPGSQETKLPTPHLQDPLSVRKSSNTEQVEERKSAVSLESWKDASPLSLTSQSQRSSKLAEERSTATSPAPPVQASEGRILEEEIFHFRSPERKSGHVCDFRSVPALLRPRTQSFRSRVTILNSRGA